MMQTSPTGRTFVDDISKKYRAVGRALIVFISLLLAVMPVTESCMQFDHFLRGGQDLELGLLAVASLFCMVLLALQHGRDAVRLLLMLQRFLSHRLPAIRSRTPRLIERSSAICLPSTAPGRCNLPLRL